MKTTIAVATFAYIKNEHNYVLLIKRSQNDSFPGRWELPGGGLDYNENPVTSIEREVKEEVGLHVTAIRPLSVTMHKNHNGTKDIVRITYECKLTDIAEEITLGADHDAFQWVEEEKLNKMEKNTPLYHVVKEVRSNFPFSNRL